MTRLTTNEFNNCTNGQWNELTIAHIDFSVRTEIVLAFCAPLNVVPPGRCVAQPTATSAAAVTIGLAFRCERDREWRRRNERSSRSHLVDMFMCRATGVRCCVVARPRWAFYCAVASYACVVRCALFYAYAPSCEYIEAVLEERLSFGCFGASYKLYSLSPL